ncbi:MAG: hypothetical protein MJ158_00515 [Alphaproteobacteria bacterium]|nr:hypothetical protein [Alphaproteobacteria bacterium]
MKLLKLLFVLFLCPMVANGADLTIYYLPSCPHCHHAKDFIQNRLVYEYASLEVTEVNVGEKENIEEFRAALQKCKYDRGGVPVIVIGDKCFQGYAENMQKDFREAIDSYLTAEEKQQAQADKAELDKDAQAFMDSHPDRKDAVAARGEKKMTDSHKPYVFYAIIGLFVLLSALFLMKKHK